MTKDEIMTKLLQMSKELDKIQESDICQNNDELMYEIGETIGSLENAIDVLED